MKIDPVRPGKRKLSQLQHLCSPLVQVLKGMAVKTKCMSHEECL